MLVGPRALHACIALEDSGIGHGYDSGGDRGAHAFADGGASSLVLCCVIVEGCLHPYPYCRTCGSVAIWAQAILARSVCGQGTASHLARRWWACEPGMWRQLMAWGSSYTDSLFFYRGCCCSSDQRADARGSAKCADIVVSDWGTDEEERHRRHGALPDRPPRCGAPRLGFADGVRGIGGQGTRRGLLGRRSSRDRRPQGAHEALRAVDGVLAASSRLS